MLTLATALGRRLSRKPSWKLIAVVASAVALVGCVIGAPAAVAAEGLVGAYAFDEGSGSTAHDESDASNDGAISGATWSSEGKFGKALLFDGIDDQVTIPDSASLDLTDGMTLEAWVKPATSAGDWKTVVLKDWDPDYLVYGMSLQGQGKLFTATYTGDGLDAVESPAALQANAWTHVAVTYEGSTLKVYVNGSPVASQVASGDITTTSGALRIGGTSVLPDEWFDGLIDEVRVYNRALSPAEIQSDRNTSISGLPSAPLPEGLVGAWGFDEGSGNGVGDKSDANNDGTISGATWSSSGRFGGALSFDGTDDRVVAPDSGSLDLDDAMTLETWVKPDTVDGNWRTVLLKEWGGDFLVYGISTGDAGKPFGTAYMYDDDRLALAEAPNALVEDTWTHLAASYDGSNLKFYVNGSQVATEPATGPVATTDGDFTIGGTTVFPDQWFDGLIDEVRVYNRALSATEIETDKDRPVSRIGQPSSPYSDAVTATPGLVSYWRLGEREGNELHDWVGGHHGLLSGGSLGVPGAMPGDQGTAIEFDAVDDSASAPLDLSGTGAVTLEFWLRWDEPSQDGDIALEHTADADAVDGGIMIEPNSSEEGKFRVAIGHGASRNDAYFDRPGAGEWHHYAIVIDTSAAPADQITPYMDGWAVPYTKSETGSGPANFADSTLNWMSRAGASRFGGGALDELAVYASALDAETVSEHVLAGLDSPPNADFNADPNPATTDETVDFDGSTSYDPDGGELHFEWDLDGDGSFETDTGADPSTSTSYETPGIYDVRLRVTDMRGYHHTATQTVEVYGDEGDIPALVQAPEIWGAPMAGENLRARRGRWGSNTPVKWDYRWYACDELGSDCTPVGHGDMLELDESRIGQWIQVRVTARNAVGGIRVSSAPVGPIVPASPPENDEPPVIRGLDGRVPVREMTLEVETLGEWYPWLGSADLYWERCNATGSNCTVAGLQSTYTLSAADVGHRVRLSVTAHGSTGDVTARSDLTEIVSDLDAPVAQRELEAPVGDTAPLPPREGRRLDADRGEWGELTGVLSSDDTDFGRTFQWLRCNADGQQCSEISGATGRSYYAVEADVGGRLRVQVHAENNQGGATELSPASEIIVAAEPPQLELHPLPSFGHFFPGHTYPVWEFNPLEAGGVDESYSWSRCDEQGEQCAEIPDATDRTYAFSEEDLGHTVRVTMTIANRAGSDSATSAPSEVVEPAPTPDVEDPPTVTPSPWGIPSVGGEPVVGAELAASDDGIWSEDMQVHNREWQWQRCTPDGETCVDIPGRWSRVNRYYTPRPRDVGSRLRVRIAGFAVHGEAWATSSMTGIVRDSSAPRVFVRPSIEGVPRAREAFLATAGTWAPDGIDLAFQWLRCAGPSGDCEEISGATQLGYQSRAADEGNVLRIRVTGTNAYGSETSLSDPTPVLGPPVPPESVDGPLIQGTARVLETLHGFAGQWHGAQPIDFDPQWLRCNASGDDCQSIAGATSWDYAVVQADAGARIRLEVTASNDIGTTLARSDPTDAIGAALPPENSQPPTIAGPARAGEELTASEGTWDHVPSGFAFVWQRCDSDGADCEDISGATSQNYLLRAADEGQRVRIAVTASNVAGQATAHSEPSDIVAPMNPPSNTSSPQIFGQSVDGSKLTSSVGIWTGGKPIDFAYQWLRCDSAGDNCGDIEGATSGSYIPQGADVGIRLRLRVRATNDAGTAEATSNRTAPVAPSPPRFVERVTLTGEAREGGELEAVTAGLRGTAPITITYQWDRCDEDCTAIGGATDATYDPVAADVGARLRVRVSAQNAVGSATSRSRTTEPVDSAADSGPPLLSARPALSGLPRATETITSTLGRWRGAEPIDVTVQWQRCADTAASCEDIPGATDTTYEVVGADVAKRLRTVSTASNSLGSASGSSWISPPMKPELHTGFVLEEPVPLADVAEAVRGTGARIVSLDYTGQRHGAYAQAWGATVDEVLDDFANGPAPEHTAVPILRFKLAGDVPMADLGAFADLVEHRFQSPSIRFTPEPPSTARAGAPANSRRSGAQAPGKPLGRRQLQKLRGKLGRRPSPTHPTGQRRLRSAEATDPLLSWARLDAWGHPCEGDDCDDVDTFYDWPNIWPLPPDPSFTRVLDTQFTWGVFDGELLRREYVEGVYFAFEFDVKLYNGNNFDVPGGVACLPWDKNDFWVSERDQAWADSDIPDYVGLYWDVADEDACDVKDLSYGVYHPEYLRYGTTYHTTIYLEGAAGDESNSTFEWVSQLLERVPPLNGVECDDNPFCVNVPPFNTIGEGEVIVPRSFDNRLPGCYEFRPWEWYFAAGCVYDTRHTRRGR